MTNPEENDRSDCVMILLANDFPTLRNLDKNRILGLNENTDAEALQTSIIRLFFTAVLIGHELTKDLR